ncbi:collagen alpha-2(I) chain-like [Lontra canadensis]|uniref:collagen alpha-2(I) chain-like n=1 Tax=Lontra canadensis TaxID=76717 RepID=UPI0013F38676|nr:collagen alpha-2(I) chain-like [Lontra canadensis]
MDPASREGEGGGWGERRRRGPAFFFIPASSFPPLVRAAAARARSRPRVSAGARSGPVTGARPPRSGPSPSPRRLAPKLLRGPAAGPDEPPRRAEDPARGLLPGPRGRAEETRGRGGTVLAESAWARRGSRPPSRPECGIFGGGGCGWKALRWRWAWPFARAGGAVAPRAPSSLAARAAPFVDASPAGARGGRGQPGASLGVWGCVNGAEAA